MTTKKQPSLRANYAYRVELVPQSLPAAEDFLNQLAVDGWRLVQYVQHSGYGIFEKQGPTE